MNRGMGLRVLNSVLFALAMIQAKPFLQHKAVIPSGSLTGITHVPLYQLKII